MPSPFPGMDPYLEDGQWLGVHTALSVEIARQLSSRLSPRYVARPNERLVVVTTGEGADRGTNADIYPDAFVSKASQPFEPPKEPAPGAASLAIAPPSLRVATIMPDPVRLVTVEIRDVAHQRLVTAIEVLSGTNKRSDGRREYLRKRRRILFSDAHLME